MQDGRPRTTVRRNRSVQADRLGRAIRWIDDWTVEAFNPVYPRSRVVRARG